VTAPQAAEAARQPPFRPLLWRLPLVALVLLGLACLQFLDRLLVREYRKEAITQAVQTDALLESFVRQRVALLSAVATMVGSARSDREASERFDLLAGEIIASSPDMLSIYLLDSAGVLRDMQPRNGRSLAALGAVGPSPEERAATLPRAASSQAAATTGTVRLGAAGRGLRAYTPIVREGRVVGYVGAGLAYRSLFNNALAGQLQGQFAYRIRDDGGSVIAVSPDFPAQVSVLVPRTVRFPNDRRWTLEVAIPRFQPIVPRAITWAVGLLLLGLVVLLVVREEARAERFAQHSRNLEMLSRDLLDANVRLEERAQQVAEANRAKSRFLANVSHELRTPINAIVGYNALALDGIYGQIAAPLRTAHERIRAAGSHLLGLVDDVLDLSKIEVGRMEVAPEPVDVGALLNAVGTVVEPIADAKRIRIALAAEPDLPRMHSDPRHLRQILLNLAANAIKFTERGTVVLGAARDAARPDTHVELSVEDTGIGIADRDLHRIFDEFEQVRPGGRGDSLERGTGLGLAISRKLARLLGGDVRVESRVGAGSRFTVTLPLVAPPLQAQRETPAHSHAVIRSDAARPLPQALDDASAPGRAARATPGTAAQSGAASGLDDAVPRG
jgi:signal transduction histidine kinase